VTDTGTGMKNQILLVFWAVLLICLMSTANLGAVNTHWQIMDCPVAENLNAIWGRSRTDIYAVGNDGMILHYDGTAWRNQTSPEQTGHLNAIWGNQTDIYIVGVNGVVLQHEYQDSWKNITSEIQNDIEKENTNLNSIDLLDIWGITDNEFIIVGKKGTIIHKKSSESWLSMTSRTFSTLNSVWGTSGSVYACGSGGKILRFMDNQWAPMTGQTFNSLNAIWGLSAKNLLYAVGDSGIILKKQSGAWTETIEDSFVNLHAVWGFSDGKVFAGGYHGTILFHDIARPEWTPMMTTTTHTIKDIWGTSSQDVYAVGEKGLILHLKQRLMIDGPLELNETDQTIAYDIHLVYALTEDLVVSLKSSDPNSINVPDEITIPAGIVEYPFDVNINDNSYIDGNSYITLTANAENWYSGSIKILMVDDEIRNLKLTIPQIASEGDAVLDDAGVLEIPGIFQDPLIIYISSNKTDKVIVPGSVEIQAGDRIAMFDLTIVDNNIMDSMVPVQISASAPGWQAVTSTITIADNEGAQLTVTVIESAVEGVGIIDNSGWVTLASVLLNDFEVTLTSDDPALVEIPYTVVVPAGKTIAMFDITIKDNNWISDPKPVKIKVEARGWYSDTDIVTIYDNDPRNLKLTLPETANENDGHLTHAAHIEIPGKYASDITIEIRNDSPQALNTPRYVLLPAGQKHTDFTISVIDNHVITDEKIVPLTLTAISPGWMTSSAQMNIIENEKKDLGLWVVESPLENEGNIAHAGTVSINGIYHKNLTVYLEVSNTDRVKIPDQIQIVAGEMSQTFDMTLIDDQEIGEKEYITIIAIAPEWKAITRLTDIVDDEKKEILLEIPSEASEGDNILLQAGKIEIPGIYQRDLAIGLSVNQTNQIEIPDHLLLPKGSTSVFFDIAITDNRMIDLRQEVIIHAAIMEFSDWSSDNASIFINDNEPRNLFLSLESEVTEGTGLYQNIGQISIPGSFIHDLTISLTSNNIGAIQPPKTVVIPKGYTQISFDCNVLDNNEITQQTNVELTAFSKDWAKSTSTIQVIDDETHQISLILPDSFIEGSGSYKNIAWIVADGIVPVNIPMTLDSYPKTDISLPSHITLTKGTIAASFDLTINDNALIDNNRSITLTATPLSSYTEWSQAFTHIDILDNEPKTIDLSIPYTCHEGVGVMKSAGMVTISGYMSEPLSIQLIATPDTEISIPQWVTIAKGHTQSQFDIFVADNHRIEGVQRIEIVATVNLPQWISSQAMIEVADNDVYQFTLTIPQTVQEGDGMLTSGNIQLAGTLAKGLQVQLISSDISRVSVPKNIIVPANTTQTNFPLTIHDNYWISGDQVIFIHAFAHEFPTETSQITILDDESPQLSLWIPDQATVGDGLLSQAGFIYLDGLFATDLEAHLSSDASEVVSIIEKQIIPAGQSTVFFDIYITESLSDLSQLVSISVEADAFIGDTRYMRIKKADAPANGDLNNDDKIDLKDVIVGLQIISGITHSHPSVHGDVDLDNMIRMQDILNIFTRLSN
jgi:hypothetical protein